MKLFLLSIVNLFLIISCKKHKPAEAAFFIRTKDPVVATVNNLAVQQGSGSNKISDFFLYVDGKFQGIYPVGSLLPVINKNQKVTVNVFAGIKNNGISATRIPYPCYDYETVDTLVESGKTLERTFVFKYGSGVKFEWLEDFNSGIGYTIKKSADSDVDFKIADASDSFEGKSLQLSLIDPQQVAQLESTLAYSLPAGSGSVYLEINYKSNSPFSVGVIGDLESKPALILNPQTSWNKIYIQLSGVVSSTPVSSKYKIFFRMINTGEYPNPKLFLDNIKLLHLQ